MKTRLLVILVSCMIGGLVLVGCRQATPTPPPPPPATPSPAPVAKATAPPLTTPKPVVKTPAPTKPPPPAAAKPQPIKIVLATSGSSSEVGWFVAEEKGYFAQAGFQMDVKRGIATNDRFAMLAKGDIDMTNTSPSAGLYNAVKRGVGVKVVAAQQVMIKGHHGNTAIVARKQLFDNGTLNSITKLKGKTIGLSGTGGVGNIQLDKTLKKAGLKPADITIKYINLNEMIPALAGGQLDAILIFGNLQLEAERQGVGKALIYADEMYPEAVASIWVYSENFAQKQTEAGKQWMLAYMKGVRDYNDGWRKNIDKEGIIQVLMKYTAMKSRELYDLITWTYIDPDGKIDVSNLAEQQDWHFEQGLLPQGKVDLSQVVDTQFMDFAIKQLGAYKY